MSGSHPVGLLSKPFFQPAPGFVHTRSGCSRRGMELGTPRDSAGQSWGSLKVLGHVPAGSLGGLAGHGEVQKATGSSNVSPLATGCPWDIPICAPQSPVMRASSFCPHTLTWTMGLHPLTPHYSQDLSHTATSSPSAWASGTIARALIQAIPGAWQSPRALVALLAMPPCSKREAGSRARMELGSGLPPSRPLHLFSRLQLGMRAGRTKPPSSVRRPHHPRPGPCGWRSWATLP